MGVAVVGSLVVMAMIAACFVGLRQFVARGDAQRHQMGLLAAIFIVLCCTTLLDENHNYVTTWDASLVNLLRQTTMLAMISLGAAVVIIAGGIDLSTGSVMVFSGTVCATFMVLLAPEAVNQSKPLGIGVIAISITGTLLVGLLVGSLHAWMITEVGLPPFVATLGTLVGLRSLSRAIVDSVTQAMLGGARSKINIADETFRELSGSTTGTVWSLTILVAILALALWLLLSKTVTGRHLYALGGNEQAARLSGIQTDRMKWLAYCISALLSSIAGILSVSQLGGIDPQTVARGYELNAIAASVVGGCSLQGGLGTIPGTLLGALFLRVVIDGVAKIIKTGADMYEGLIVGVLVVFAVTFTKSSDSRSTTRGKLFAGPLGWVTMLNLTLLAGVMMALLGAKVVKDRAQMDSAWQAAIASISAFCLLMLIRSSLSHRTKRTAGMIWAVATIAIAIGADQAYPRVQRSSAVAAVRSLGGTVSQNDEGALIVDLEGSSCDDSALKQLLPQLRFFTKIADLRLGKTKITDAGLEAVGKQFNQTKLLQRVDVTETEATSRGMDRLKQTLDSVDVRP